MKQYKVIISGGGTGGHLFPAIAIAEELLIKYPKTDILFVAQYFVDIFKDVSIYKILNLLHKKKKYC